MPNSLHHLFEKNRLWAESIKQRDPEFFRTLAGQQAPEYLWIGCSDSRVPANEIVALAPGEVFVHRNVANLVVHTDLNCLAVIQFAVDVLKIKHIMVVGHYGCSGVRAALERRRIGLADNWLRHVQDVHEKHREWVDAVPDAHVRYDLLCELNVIEQVMNVCHSSVVHEAWERGQELTVHGWVYGLRDGRLRDLAVACSGAAMTRERYDAALKALRGNAAPA
jgi:carbonic anhydrase